MKTDDELRAGCDAIQADMAKHQTMFHGEVTATANQRLAAETFEQLEKQWAEEEANPYAKPAPKPRESIEHTETKATVDDRTYTISRGPDDLKFRKANEAEQWFITHAWPRVELLLTKMEPGSAGEGAIGLVPLSRYSWHDRVLIACRWQQIDKTRFMYELVQTLDDSDRHFKPPWKDDAPRKVIVGG